MHLIVLVYNNINKYLKYIYSIFSTIFPIIIFDRKVKSFIPNPSMSMYKCYTS